MKLKHSGKCRKQFVQTHQGLDEVYLHDLGGRQRCNRSKREREKENAKKTRMYIQQHQSRTSA